MDQEKIAATIAAQIAKRKADLTQALDWLVQAAERAQRTKADASAMSGLETSLFLVRSASAKLDEAKSIRSALGARTLEGAHMEIPQRPRNLRRHKTPPLPPPHQ